MTMTRPKVILHLITGLEVGGAESMLLKILPRACEGIEHHVCSIIGIGPIGDKLAAKGIRVHHLDLQHPIDLGVTSRLRQQIKAVQPDVLITYLPHADLLGRIVGRAMHVPKIITSIRVKITRSKYLPFFILDGLTSPLVHHYHFNSVATADLHRRYLGIPRRKTTVIPNGIELEQFNNLPDQQEARRVLQLPADKILVCCVARLRRQKGHRYLIQAFRHVTHQYPDAMLVLVGDGEEKQSILAEIDRQEINKNVIMLGNRHDVPHILAAVDIFVLTTLFEGMSNSIMEAMAAGLPIVTTDIPENRELITNGRTGLLHPPRDPLRAADALLELITNKAHREMLGRAAQEDIRARFNIEKIAQRYQTFYEQL
ncbi:MAG: hypothetical protein COT71_01745 [Candidatus Andersenbacteria bacterium CG10_big_fil_rev_8_21_14_0_10_54_11]|uniref:Glycosyltransferase n=1 Tax=Candidatus Andersenbacteria bacterium CG10_big_fil_rev_8_21_14_0_10_54_11 TaxID=1974485 RepID=A0A2M6WZR6_9BACT|nr:MAG: hypothetical protein COT71_01745 [Candidatus Andersenbacteria bacterium CG10_big_fil_rev_8_21_14_0_10_54_11]